MHNPKISGRKKLVQPLKPPQTDIAFFCPLDFFVMFEQPPRLKMPTINSKKNNSKEVKANIFRGECKAMLDEGFSISAIAKKIGSSYAHTKNICMQIKAEI